MYDAPVFLERIMFLPDINHLIRYENNKVISRYNQDFPHAKMRADDALTELMKFVWLCCKHKSDRNDNPENNVLNFSCMIHPEMVDIDNMWHTFLLFTKDYHQFCNDYLDGNFFHHEPVIDTDNPMSDETYEQELTRYLSYIYDNLGEDTLMTWFGQCL